MAAAHDAFRDATRQLADAAQRASRVALETAEGVFGVQLKAFGSDLAQTTGYLGELARSPGPDGIRQLLPKGTQLLNDSLERWADAHQQVMDLGLRSRKAWQAAVQAGTTHNTAGAAGNSH
ncbi:phasin family protein [Stenotrophomonas sp. 24(2023)]|uniref:phasin family protein n=1 Tax=Stenotrophomonas sp. 24(2023) TaxID=3068324 RepID=UPI0027E1CEFA|nr:phasin family protein [Stenotrophomonas sp. 24(2023)]WMJ67714.1 phasin family protein [Stenotrophomonas sp. 24(2023)]